MSSLSAIKIKGEREGPSTDEENRELVLSYLQRLSNATNLLAEAGGTTWQHKLEGDDSRMIDVTKGESSSFYVDQIARHLLAACRPEILASGISNLPPFKKVVPGSDEDDFVVFDDDGDNEQDEDEGGEELQHWTVRRTDYLRQLLRVLAPISMDVAGQVCSIALSSSATAAAEAANSNESLVLPTVLLLAHWLPVAPHLAALVTDVLQSLKIHLNPTVVQSSLVVELVVTESFLGLCTFFGRRGEIAILQRIWDWTFVFGMMAPRDVVMEMEDDPSTSLSTTGPSSTPSSSMLQRAVRWHAARIVACLLDWKPSLVAMFLKRLDLENEQVPWKIHPWSLDREESSTQHLHMKGLGRLWDSEDFSLPSADEVRKVLPLHSWFVHLGMGLVTYKHGAIAQSLDNEGDIAGDNIARSRLDKQLKHRSPQRLTGTPTTCRNLALLGIALCQEPYPPPVLICGPHGSGKSSLIRELMRLCNPNGTLLEIHVDEETDSKTLIGSYNPTDIPGEFAWRAGALTQATRIGQWVLLEDVDAVPVEIQATLVKLLEDRLVPLGNGKYEPCHPNFRLFGTCTTTVSRQLSNNKDSLRIGRHRGGGKQILNPSLWRKVHVDPLPFSELKDVALALHPNIPESVSESALAILQAQDRSGRNYSSKIEDRSDDSEVGQPESVLWIGGRPPSVRDFFKLLSRISHDIRFEPNASYATETQRTLCLAESVDVFCGSCPERKMRHEFINRLAAPIWGISRDLALRYVETRQPTTLIGVDFIEVGRAKIEMVSRSEFARKPSETFAQTNHSLRLMEAIGVCIRENEPVLLVGETGCGKSLKTKETLQRCALLSYAWCRYRRENHTCPATRWLL
jgi:energy-coupling factor transporter ATP-binding protein EcfA2